MKAQRILAFTAVLVLVGAAAVALPRLWRWYTAPPAGHCPICLRQEHQESMVRFQAEGEPVTSACCLSCALTYGRQTHKSVRIISVTDHDNGGEITADRASFVAGSNISPCIHAMTHTGEEKEQYAVEWDRCLPSILAFSSPQAAEAFRARHGGRVRSLRELIDQRMTSDATDQ